MPTVLRDGPYRFYWYSHEPGEPPHVHVDHGDRSAKFWLRPVALVRDKATQCRACGLSAGLSRPGSKNSWRQVMGALAVNADERVASVEFTEEFLVDGLMGR